MKERLKTIFYFLGVITLLGFITAATYQTGQLIASVIELEGYTSATDSNRSEEINPIDQRYIYETLADISNYVEAGPPDTLYYYVDASGFRKISFQLVLDCDAGTIVATVEGTLENDCAPGSCSNYEDLTNDTFGVANLTAAAAPATDVWIDNSEKLGNFKYIRIKIVSNTGDDSGDWLILNKRLY